MARTVIYTQGQPTSRCWPNKKLLCGATPSTTPASAGDGWLYRWSCRTPAEPNTPAVDAAVTHQPGADEARDGAASGAAARHLNLPDHNSCRRRSQHSSRSQTTPTLRHHARTAVCNTMTDNDVRFLPYVSSANSPVTTLSAAHDCSTPAPTLGKIKIYVYLCACSK